MIQDQLIPHPYAACYPLVSGILEESLYESIKTNGLRQPLVLWRDEERECIWMIDGRNRHRALCQLQGGVREDQVMWCTYQSDEDVRLAVLDYNENRRQMSTAQKSVVAGRILKARAVLFSEQAEEDTKASLDVNVVSSSLSEVNDDELDDEPPFDLDEEPVTFSHAVQSDIDSRAPMHLPSSDSLICPPEVRREVAATLGIGPKTAQKGAQVVNRGAPKLVSALEDGLVSVEAAYTLTQLDDEELESIVSQGKKAMRDKAKELKGGEKESKAQEESGQLIGDVEITRMTLGWTEKMGDGMRRFDLEVTEPEHLQALLGVLTQMGLRGELNTLDHSNE
jgi:hypothetical protein